MSLEYSWITEEEMEEFVRSMEGYFSQETIEDFKKLCEMDLYLI